MASSSSLNDWSAMKQLRQMYEVATIQHSLYCRGLLDQNPQIFYKICQLDSDSSSLLNEKRGFFGPTEFTKECQYATLAGKNLVGPAVNDSIIQINEDGIYGCISMEKMHTSLKDFIVSSLITLDNCMNSSFSNVTNPALLEKTLDEMLRVLRVVYFDLDSIVYTMWNVCNFIHMDLHPDNILFLNSNMNVIRFIDFARVIPKSDFEKGPVFSGDHYTSGNPKTYQFPDQAFERSTRPTRNMLNEILKTVELEILNENEKCHQIKSSVENIKNLLRTLPSKAI